MKINKSKILYYARACINNLYYLFYEHYFIFGKFLILRVLYEFRWYLLLCNRYTIYTIQTACVSHSCICGCNAVCVSKCFFSWRKRWRHHCSGLEYGMDEYMDTLMMIVVIIIIIIHVVQSYLCAYTYIISCMSVPTKFVKYT